MKSVQIKGYSSSDVVEINDTASEPTLSSGKVLVIIKAAGVNPADWKNSSHKQYFDLIFLELLFLVVH
jgi:NADPH:quinone reductase-like Zn-dependent oxidoreductase